MSFPEPSPGPARRPARVRGAVLGPLLAALGGALLAASSVLAVHALPALLVPLASLWVGLALAVSVRLLLALLGPPRWRGASWLAPAVFLAVLTGLLAPGLGRVLPALEERRALRIQAGCRPLVQALEEHRRRTGAYPRGDPLPLPAPEGVVYAPVGDPATAYRLRLADRFDPDGGWEYDGATGTWRAGGAAAD